MATGTPRAPRNGNARQIGTDVVLHFPGKRPEADVINGPTLVTKPVGETAADATVKADFHFGDNLPIMRGLLASLRGKVKLVYVDPPYASSGNYATRSLHHAYEDGLHGAEFIAFLRERLILLRELLSEEGSIYVHLDDNMAFTIKVVMDEVFGQSNFRNFIVRKKCNPKNYTRNQFGNIADYILFYSRSSQYTFTRQFQSWQDETAAKEYSYSDEQGRRYKRVPIHAPGVRNGETGKVWRGLMPPPGKHWQYTPQTLEEMDARGEIHWSKNGNPRRKIYLDNSAGIALQDIWLDVKDPHNQNIKVTGYPTEKNAALLERIILASSAPDDIVLDAFVGSGTTMAAALKHGRRAIGIDESPVALKATLSRFVHGSAPMGDFVSAPKPAQREFTFHSLVVHAEARLVHEAQHMLQGVLHDEASVA